MVRDYKMWDFRAAALAYLPYLALPMCISFWRVLGEGKQAEASLQVLMIQFSMQVRLL